MSDLEIMSKLTVGGQEFSNRLALAPLTRARGTPTEDPMDPKNRIPNEIQAEYYEQRASAGLVISEATAISEDGYGWLNAPAIMTEDEIAGWKNVTDKVHAKGGHMYLQLWHMGRQSHTSFHPNTKRVVSASNIPFPGKVKTAQFEEADGEIPHSLTKEEIKQTVADFIQAGQNALAAGFDGVEVHAANGYLIDQFLQSSSNVRTDEYGGSCENRLRILVEIIEGLIASGFPANRIGFRISPNGAFGGMGAEDNFEMFTYLAKELNKYGLAYMHVMDGLGFGYHGKCKVTRCADLRKHWDGIIICNVGLTKEIAEGMVRSGAADMCAFGRLYISNPDLAERFANNYPLEESAPYESWWQHTGAKGYTDWKVYTPEEEKKEGAEEKKEDAEEKKD